LRPKHVEWPCRNKTCTVLHQVGVSFDLYYDARKHKIKIMEMFCTHLNYKLNWHTSFSFNCACTVKPLAGETEQTWHSLACAVKTVDKTVRVCGGLRCGFTSARFLRLWVRIQWAVGCLSLVSDVCCQVKVSATGRSLIQRNPTKCGVSDCDGEPSTKWSPWPTWGVLHRKQNFHSASGAHDCEYRRWRSWDPELSSAWGCGWVSLSPGNINMKMCTGLWPFRGSETYGSLFGRLR
jgi:hypothetical protein